MKKGTVALLSTLIGAAAGAAGSGYLGSKQVEQKAEKVDKFKGYYNMLNQWLILKQEGKNLSEYFKNNNYKTIAIYGMGEMGNRLLDELKQTSIEVKYAIDKNAGGTYTEVDVFSVDDNLPNVDVIVISAVFDYDKIEEELSQKVDMKIISLEDAIYEC